MNTKPVISLNMIDAIIIKFVEPIFEDDFVEKGMVAWLVDVQWEEKSQCYNLWFDFTEFEDINDKYFKQTYFPNIHTKELEKNTSRKLFTAKEAGMYNPKYSVYFSVGWNLRDDELFEEKIKNYLRVV